MTTTAAPEATPASATGATPAPPAARRRGTLPAVTWRLVVAAVGGSVLVLVLPLPAPLGLIVVNGALLAAAALDWWRAPRPRALRVERDLPGIVPLGAEATVTWQVTSPHPRPLRVALADELAPSLRAASRHARLVVPAGGRARARTTIRPSRRGAFTPREVTVRVEGPLGLAARQGLLEVPGTLRVYPPFRSREEAELRIDRARILEIGLRSAQGRGGGTEFDSLREYGTDDEFRKIDWAATARASKAIVRTYRAERNQTVLVLLDAGRTMAGRIELPEATYRPSFEPSFEPSASPNRSLGSGERLDFHMGTSESAAGRDGERLAVPRLDHAMDAVMMLTAVATRLGDRAGLVAFDSEVRAVVPPGHTRRQLTSVTEAMYALEPGLVESDYRGAFAHTLARFRRRALLVVLTELAHEAVTETLLPALPLVARSHLVVIAGVTDPDVARWAHALPADATGAYRKAAAIAALDNRRATIARLRSLGAVVIDAEPGQLAPQLADAYLKVKATGRL